MKRYYSIYPAKAHGHRYIEFDVFISKPSTAPHRSPSTQTTANYEKSGRKQTLRQHATPDRSLSGQTRRPLAGSGAQNSEQAAVPMENMAPQGADESHKDHHRRFQTQPRQPCRGHNEEEAGSHTGSKSSHTADESLQNHHCRCGLMPYNQANKAGVISR